MASSQEYEGFERLLERQERLWERQVKIWREPEDWNQIVSKLRRIQIQKARAWRTPKARRTRDWNSQSGDETEEPRRRHPKDTQERQDTRNQEENMCYCCRLVQPERLFTPTKIRRRD